MVKIEEKFKMPANLYTISTIRGRSQWSSLLPKNKVKSLERFESTEEPTKRRTIVRQSMNWIANAFVAGKLGDVRSAIATINRRRGIVTFHISDNNGTDTTQLATSKANWTKLKSLLDTLKGTDLKTASVLQTGVQTLVKHVITVGWDRLWAKVENIGRISQNPSSTEKKFDILLKHWKEKGHLHACMGELSKIVSRDPKQTDDDFVSKGVENLIGTMKKLLYPEGVPQEAEGDLTDLRFKAFDSAANSCRHILIVLDAIMDRSESGALEGYDCPQNEDIGTEFVVSMHNRLWRVLKYKTGAQTLLQRGLTYFRGRTGVKKGTPLQFDIKWVAEHLPQESKAILNNPGFKEFAVTDFRDLLTDTVFTKFPNDEHITEKNQIISKLATSLNGNTIKFRPKFHCEIAMMHYIKNENLDPEQSIIGVSKLNCWSCDTYFSLMTPESSSGFFMSGTSGKAHPNWLLPDSASATDKDFRRQVKVAADGTLSSIIGEICDQIMIGLTRDVIVGSDSSTASEFLQPYEILE